MEFKTALSGYDRQQVDETIASYDRDINALRQQVGQLTDEAASLRTQTEQASLQASETGNKLETVQSQYDAFRRQASETVSKLREEVSQYKKKTDELQNKTDKPWAAAGTEAQRLVDAAGKQAEDIISKANKQAETIRSEAKATAEQMMADARAEAERQQKRAQQAVAHVKSLYDTIGKVQQILGMREDEPAGDRQGPPATPAQQPTVSDN